MNPQIHQPKNPTTEWTVAYEKIEGTVPPIATHVLTLTPRLYVSPKPKMWKCPKTRMHYCLLEGVRGTGTTRTYAYNQMWAILNITHPHLKKPEARRKK